MKTRNFQIENKLSNSKQKKIQMPPFRQLSFGVSNALAYIVVITLIRIIITLSRILVNFFFKVKHFKCTRAWPEFTSGYLFLTPTSDNASNFTPTLIKMAHTYAKIKHGE